MAVTKFTGTGKWSEAGKWSGGKVPGKTEEAEIASGECIMEAAGECLSLTVASGATLKTGPGETEPKLELGSTTTVPKAGGKEGYLVYIPSGAKVESSRALLTVVSTVKASALLMAIVPESKMQLKFNSGSIPKGELKLEAAWTTTGVVNIETSEGTFNTNGFAVSTGSWTISGTKAKIKLSGSITDTNLWNWTSAEATLEAGESTLIVDGNFTGGGKTYWNVTLEGSSQELKKSNTFHVLKLGKPGMTVKVEAGSVQTVTTLECAGTEGSPVTIESGTAESKWKIKAAGAQSVKWLKVQDSKAETSTFTTEGPSGKEAEYLVRSTNEESKWVFKAIAAGTAIAFSTKATFATATLAKVLQKQPVTAATKQTFATSTAASVKQVQPATATTKLVFKGTANPRQSQPVMATTKVPFASSASVKQSQPVTATGKVRFKGATELAQEQVLYVVAQGMTLFGSTVRIRQVQPVAASTKVRMAGSLTVEEEGVASASYICMIL